MVEKSNEHFLTCKDYTVSNEVFKLIWNKERDILITDPQPKPEELPNYYKSENYISHTDASKSIVDKMYQQVKSLMLLKKIKLINSFHSSSNNLLDIGAGTGDFLKKARKNGWNITGVEPNEKARDFSVKKGIPLLPSTKKLADSSYDIITLWHVLEHISDLEKQLQELHSLLKQNGKLIIAVPNFKSFDATYYKKYWAAYDVPRHLWHFSPEGIERLFKQHKFIIQKKVALPFDAFYVSLLSEKYKNSKINYLKAFLIGMKSNFLAKKSKNYSSLIYVFQKAT